MKRTVSLIALLMILFLGMQLLLTFVKDTHNITYEIISDGKTYGVKEIYQKENGNSYYLELDIEGKVFNYTIPNIFNKKKEIVSEIKTTKMDNLLCVYPVFEKKLTTYNITCEENGTLYSYETVKNNPVVVNFVSSLKAEGFKVTAWDPSVEKTTKGEQSTVYTGNILEEDKILVWIYERIEEHTRKENKTFNSFTYEKYENTHGTLVDHYYIVPEYSSDRVYDFETLLVYDILKHDRDRIRLSKKISQNTYIQGVVDGKVYYLDKDNVIQYEVNPKELTIKEIGNKDLNAKYYNGEWQEVNIYELVNEEKKFKLAIPEELNAVTNNIVEIFETESTYYYYTATGEFYRVLKGNTEKRILLFQVNNPKEVLLKEDTLYYISGDSLYYYSEEFGHRPILKNNEFLYNSKNRYQVYKQKESKESE